MNIKNAKAKYFFENNNKSTIINFPDENDILVALSSENDNKTKEIRKQIGLFFNQESFYVPAIECLSSMANFEVQNYIIDKLVAFLNQDSRFIPISDIIIFFSVLFYEIPFFENISQNECLLAKVFLMQNIIISKYYNSAFFGNFYNISYPNNVFSMPLFVVLGFFDVFPSILAQDSNYVDLLYENNTISTILNKLVELRNIFSNYNNDSDLSFFNNKNTTKNSFKMNELISLTGKTNDSKHVNDKSKSQNDSQYFIQTNNLEGKIKITKKFNKIFSKLITHLRPNVLIDFYMNTIGLQELRTELYPNLSFNFLSTVFKENELDNVDNDQKVQLIHNFRLLELFTSYLNNIVSLNEQIRNEKYEKSINRFFDVCKSIFMSLICDDVFAETIHYFIPIFSQTIKMISQIPLSSQEFIACLLSYAPSHEDAYEILKSIYIKINDTINIPKDNCFETVQAFLNLAFPFQKNDHNILAQTKQLEIAKPVEFLNGFKFISDGSLIFLLKVIRSSYKNLRIEEKKIKKDKYLSIETVYFFANYICDHPNINDDILYVYMRIVINNEHNIKLFPNKVKLFFLKIVKSEKVLHSHGLFKKFCQKFGPKIKDLEYLNDILKSFIVSYDEILVKNAIEIIKSCFDQSPSKISECISFFKYSIFNRRETPFSHSEIISILPFFEIIIDPTDEQLFNMMKQWEPLMIDINDQIKLLKTMIHTFGFISFNEFTSFIQSSRPQNIEILSIIATELIPFLRKTQLNKAVYETSKILCESSLCFIKEISNFDMSDICNKTKSESIQSTMRYFIFFLAFHFVPNILNNVKLIFFFSLENNLMNENEMEMIFKIFINLNKIIDSDTAGHLLKSSFLLLKNYPHIWNSKKALEILFSFHYQMNHIYVGIIDIESISLFSTNKEFTKRIYKFVLDQDDSEKEMLNDILSNS